MENIKFINKEDTNNLLTSDRLDIVVKMLYIESYITKKRYDYFLDLYKRHIFLRTGGIEDNKKNIEDFINVFNTLIDDFKVNGFDKNYPIPVSIHNNKIVNGAHRLACSIYFKTGCYIEYKNGYGNSWGYDWFIDQNINDHYLHDIMYKYIELKKENLYMAVLWGAIEQSWDKVENKIKSNQNIVGRIDYKFSKDEFITVVEEMYSYEFGVYPSNTIRNKIKSLLKYPTSFSLLIVEDNETSYIYREGIKTNKQAYITKTAIREMLHTEIDVDKYITMHTTDNSEHNLYISNILLNTFNLEVITKRKALASRKEFLKWLVEFKETLLRYNIDLNDCCVVGSSSLEVMGIRESTDIDFILKKEVRDKIFTDDFMLLSENVDIVCSGYHRSSSKNIYSDDEIISDIDKHFYFKGIKFANIEIIKERKEYQKRPKDLKDVELIKSFSHERKNKSLKGTFQEIPNKLSIYFQIYIVAYIRHRILGKFTSWVARHLNKEQKDFIKRFFRRKSN